MYAANGAQFTNVMPNTGNTPFNTGTNVSNTADTSLRCSPGAGGWQLNTYNSAVRALDLTSGRYLNLHQCVYAANGAQFTNVMPNTGNTPFNTGTNVSNTADTSLRCSPGAGGWQLNTYNSAVRALDLTSGRYLNLHQCVYAANGAQFTNVMPNTGNTPFNTGTNVSNTADTSLRCSPGAGGWQLNTYNSAVRALDLTST
ncbi:hypothetical protein AB8O64_02895 [Streptomyces sp. QH1-20]|uniref:hypothetical protein n=1 Tax=Streptomyces sp. QH1-20 TaxID=3240934 RepID=UPI0035194FFB